MKAFDPQVRRPAQDEIHSNHVDMVERRKMNNKKSIAVLAALFLVIIAVFGVIFFFVRPNTETGVKHFTLEVVLADGSSKEYELTTDKEYLGEALLALNMIAGEEGDYGLYMTAVTGVTANEANQEWWCLTMNHGETVNYGISQLPVTNGTHYELTLMVGW